MSTVKATTNTFREEVLESDIPVLVDFWAEWCGPCRAIAPTLETLAAEREGTLKVVKVDIDENPDLAAQYRITSIPNLVVFSKGAKVGQIIGAVPKSEIERALADVL